MRGAKNLNLPITKRHIDQLVAGIVLAEAGQQKFTGIEQIDGIINWLDKTRHVGTSFVLSKAAEDLGVNSLLVFQLSKQTLGELRQKDSILQRHKHFYIQNLTHLLVIPLLS